MPSDPPGLEGCPFLTADLPPVPGRLRSVPGDFAVEEIPLYEPSGRGDHLLFKVEKTGVSTFEAIRRLARALGRPPRDFGHAGLKDARAVAVQHLSLEKADEKALAALSIPGVRVLEAARHGNKLKVGHLAGNRFRIRYRDAGREALAAAQRVLVALERRGVPNAYMEQRFGLHRDTHRLGRALLSGDAEAPAGKGVPRRDKQLYLSAYQSYLFNRILALRAPALGEIEEGDLAWLHGKGAVFEVEDPVAEAPRAASFEISPSGPIYGYKTRLASGRPGEAEEALLREEGFAPGDWRIGQGLSQKGARRPLRVPLAEASVEAEGDDLVFRFFLPKGSYATAVFREIGKGGRLQAGGSG